MNSHKKSSWHTLVHGHLKRVRNRLLLPPPPPAPQPLPQPLPERNARSYPGTGDYIVRPVPVPRTLRQPTLPIYGWENIPCSDFSDQDMIVAHVLSILTGNPQQASLQASPQTANAQIARDTRCAILNKLDLGTLCAIARVRWLPGVCRKCLLRPAIGNEYWSTAPCITGSHMSSKVLQCGCSLDATCPGSTVKQKQALYEPQIDGDTIMNATCVPPRRLWDLKANRVILFYGKVSKLCTWCLENEHMASGVATAGHYLDRQQPLQRPHLQPFEQEYWAVSHSWTDGMDAHSLDTPINSYQWAVPMPQGSSLEDVRQELRACGAEYAWLDVVCLRQRNKVSEGSNPQLLVQEDLLRAKEWEVDVPTIGNIYRNASGVLRYFNGLGQRFNPDVGLWSEPRHWTNRAWTLQEMRPEEEMVNAGFETAKRLPLRTPLNTPAGPLTLREMLKPLSEIGLAAHSSHGISIIELAKHMSKRFATTPVDKIAGINYLIWPKGWTFNLPIYRETIQMEKAWLRCVQSMRRDLKVELLFLFPHPRKSIPDDPPEVLTWVPTWSQIEEFEGCVWTDLTLRVISPDVYSDPLHPIIVPTLLWGLKEPLGTLVFDDCRLRTTSSTPTSIQYDIMLGFRNQSSFTPFQFHSKHPTVMESSNMVLLCLSLEVNLPWVLCAETRTAAEILAKYGDGSNYNRVLALEKRAILKTDERFLISQRYPISTNIGIRAYDAIFVM